jgi:serine/threonine protein kinase
MLHLDPNRRPTASQVLQHNWIQHRNVLPTHRLPLQEASVIKVILLVLSVQTVMTKRKKWRRRRRI